MFIAINTAPQIIYAVSCLTRYIVVSTPAHLEVAKQVLRYLRGVKGDMIRWCARDVSSTHTVGQVYGYADSVQASLMIVPIANPRLPTFSLLTMLSFLGDLV